MSLCNKVNSIKSLEYDSTVKHGLGYVGQDCVAGIFSTFTHSWLACGPNLYIVSLSDGSLLSSWTFGETSAEHFDITCAIELPFEGCVIPLLIVGISSENLNQICFFNPNTRKIIRAIETNYPVRILCITEDGLSEVNPINNALTKTQGLFAAGCADGSLLLFDLCRGILLKGLSGDFGFISDEDDPVETICLDVSAISSSSVQQKLKECYTKQNNFAVCLTSSYDEGVTALTYSFESAILFVGTSCGSFSLWNMSSLNCILKSQSTGRAVISLSLLEPCDDPRHNLFLWICYENYPQAVMYCISFASKYYVPGYGVYYQGFESAGVVYRLVLGLDENLVAKRAINSQSVVKAVSKNTSKSLNQLDGDYQLRLFVTSYEVYNKGHSSNRAVVFDLNQWYKEQMPDEGLSLCLDTVTLDANTLWHLALDPSSVSPYQWARPLEQHFHPTALDFRVWCIEEEGVKCFEKFGLQNQWLRNMSVVGPSALLSPTQLFQGALSAGLLPLFDEPPDPECTSVDDERKYVLTICLENRAISFIETCAKDWASGGHPVAGCTLLLLINWLWEQHGIYKNHGNRMCIPLFDQSGIGFDVSERRALQHCKSLLCTVESLYMNIVRNYRSFSFLGAVEKKLAAMSLVKFYFDCCLKLISAKLLPEPNDAGRPNDSFAYKFDEISEFVSLKRKQGPFLGDSLIGKTGGEIQWEEEGGNGRYPPPSVQSVLRYCLHPAPPVWNKLSLMLYLYMDILNSHKPLRDQSNFDEVKNFQYLLRISDVQYKIVSSFWFLDHSLFEEGVSLLLDPRVLSADLSDDQHRSVLTLLAVQGQEKLALQYLRLKAPALHHPNDLKLELELLLGNRLINEAFMFQRKHPELRETLLIQFFKGCISKKLLNLVFGLHLDPTEEAVLLKFLKTSDLKEKGDLQVLLLLSRAKYIEAMSLNDRLNTTLNGPRVRLETDTRDMIVRGITGGMNPISRRLAYEMKQYHPPPPGTCPKPLSALIKIRSEPDGPLCQADSSVLLSAAAKSVRHLSDFINSDGGKRKRSDSNYGEIMDVDYDDPPRKKFAPSYADNGLVKQITSAIGSNGPITPFKSAIFDPEREVMELVGTPLVKKRGKRFSPRSRPSSILKGKTPEKGLVLDEQGDTPRKTLRFALPENERRVTGRKSLHLKSSSLDGYGEKGDKIAEVEKLSGQLKPVGSSSRLKDGGVNWSDIAEASKPRILFSQGTSGTPSSQSSHTFMDITVSSAEKRYLDSPSRENEPSPVTEAVFNMTVPKRLFTSEENVQDFDDEINEINKKYKETAVERFKELRRNKTNLKPTINAPTQQKKIVFQEEKLSFSFKSTEKPLSSCQDTERQPSICEKGSSKEEIIPDKSLYSELSQENGGKEEGIDNIENNDILCENSYQEKSKKASEAINENVKKTSLGDVTTVHSVSSRNTEAPKAQSIEGDQNFGDNAPSIEIVGVQSLDTNELDSWQEWQEDSEKNEEIDTDGSNSSEEIHTKEDESQDQSVLGSEHEETGTSSDSGNEDKEKFSLSSRKKNVPEEVILVDSDSCDDSIQFQKQSEGSGEESPRSGNKTDDEYSLDYEDNRNDDDDDDNNSEEDISDSEIFGLSKNESENASKKSDKSKENEAEPGLTSDENDSVDKNESLNEELSAGPSVDEQNILTGSESEEKIDSDNDEDEANVPLNVDVIDSDGSSVGTIEIPTNEEDDNDEDEDYLSELRIVGLHSIGNPLKKPVKVALKYEQKCEKVKKPKSSDESKESLQSSQVSSSLPQGINQADIEIEKIGEKLDAEVRSKFPGEYSLIGKSAKRDSLPPKLVQNDNEESNIVEEIYHILKPEKMSSTEGEYSAENRTQTEIKKDSDSQHCIFTLSCEQSSFSKDRDHDVSDKNLTIPVEHDVNKLLVEKPNANTEIDQAQDKNNAGSEEGITSFTSEQESVNVEKSSLRCTEVPLRDKVHSSLTENKLNNSQTILGASLNTSIKISKTSSQVDSVPSEESHEHTPEIKLDGISCSEENAISENKHINPLALGDSSIPDQSPLINLNKSIDNSKNDKELKESCILQEAGGFSSGHKKNINSVFVTMEKDTNFTKNVFTEVREVEETSKASSSGSSENEHVSLELSAENVDVKDTILREVSLVNPIDAIDNKSELYRSSTELQEICVMEILGETDTSKKENDINKTCDDDKSFKMSKNVNIKSSEETPVQEQIEVVNTTQIIYSCKGTPFSSSKENILESTIKIEGGIVSTQVSSSTDKTKVAPIDKVCITERDETNKSLLESSNETGIVVPSNTATFSQEGISTLKSVRKTNTKSDKTLITNREPQVTEDSQPVNEKVDIGSQKMGPDVENNDTINSETEAIKSSYQNIEVSETKTSNKHLVENKVYDLSIQTNETTQSTKCVSIVESSIEENVSCVQALELKPEVNEPEINKVSTNKPDVAFINTAQDVSSEPVKDRLQSETHLNETNLPEKIEVLNEKPDISINIPAVKTNKTFVSDVLPPQALSEKLTIHELSVNSDSKKTDSGKVSEILEKNILEGTKQSFSDNSPSHALPENMIIPELTVVSDTGKTVSDKASEISQKTVAEATKQNLSSNSFSYKTPQPPSKNLTIHELKVNSDITKMDSSEVSETSQKNIIEGTKQSLSSNNSMNKLDPPICELPILTHTTASIDTENADENLISKEGEKSKEVSKQIDTACETRVNITACPTTEALAVQNITSRNIISATTINESKVNSNSSKIGSDKASEISEKNTIEGTKQSLSSNKPMNESNLPTCESPKEERTTTNIDTEIADKNLKSKDGEKSKELLKQPDIAETRVNIVESSKSETIPAPVVQNISSFNISSKSESVVDSALRSKITTQLPKRRDESLTVGDNDDNKGCNMIVSEVEASNILLKIDSSKPQNSDKIFFFGNNDSETFLRASKATFQVGSRVSLSGEDEPVNPMETAMIEEVIEDEGEVAKEDERDVVEEEVVIEDEETDPRNTCMLDVDFSLHLSEDEVQNDEPKKVDKSIATTDTYLTRKARRSSRKIESGTSKDSKTRISIQIEHSEKTKSDSVKNIERTYKQEGDIQGDKKSFSTQTSDSLHDIGISSDGEKEVLLKPKTSKSVLIPQSTETTSEESFRKEKSSRRSTRVSEIKGILKTKDSINQNSDYAKDLRIQVNESPDDAIVVETDAEAIVRNRALRSHQKKHLEDKGARTDPYEIIEDVHKNVNVKKHRRSSVNSQNSDDAKDLCIRNESSEVVKKSRRFSKEPIIQGILKKTTAYEETKVKRSSHIADAAEDSLEKESTDRLPKEASIGMSSSENQIRRSARKSLSKDNIFNLPENEVKKTSRDSVGTEIRGILKKKDSKTSRQSCTSETSGELLRRVEDDFPEVKKRSRRYSEEPELHSILKRSETLNKKSRRSIHSIEMAQELHSRFEDNLEYKRKSRRHSSGVDILKKENAQKHSTSHTSDTATDLRIRVEEDFPEEKIHSRRKSVEIQGILKNKDGSDKRKSYTSEMSNDLRLSPSEEGPVERRKSRRRSVDHDLIDSNMKDSYERRSRRLSQSSEASDIRTSRDDISDSKKHSRKSLLLNRYKEEEDKKFGDRSSVSSDQATDLRLRIEEDFPEVDGRTCTSKYSESKRSKKNLVSDDESPEKNVAVKRQRRSLSTEVHNDYNKKHKRSSLGSYTSEESARNSGIRLEEDFPEDSVKGDRIRQRKSVSEKSERRSIRSLSHDTDNEADRSGAIKRKDSSTKESFSLKKSLLDLPAEESLVYQKKTRSLQDFPIRRSTRLLHPILEDIKEEEEETPRKKRRSLDDLDAAAYQKKVKSVLRKKEEPKVFPPLVIAESDSDFEASPIIKEVWTAEGYAKERRLTRNQKKVLLRNQQLMENTPSPSTSSTPTKKQSRKRTPVPDSPQTPTRSSLRLQNKRHSESEN